MRNVTAVDKKIANSTASKVHDDMPSLFVMDPDSRGRSRETSVSNYGWIGSMAKGAQQPVQQRRKLKLYESILYEELDKESNRMGKSTVSYRQQEREPIPQTLSRVSIHSEDKEYMSDRIRYLGQMYPDNNRWMKLLEEILRSKKSDSEADINEPRHLLAMLLTSQTKRNKYVQSLLELMTDISVSSESVLNLYVLILLLSKVTEDQDSIYVRHTSADIEVSFSQGYIKKRENEILGLKKAVEERTYEMGYMVREYEEVIADMQENIKSLALKKKYVEYGRSLADAGTSDVEITKSTEIPLSQQANMRSSSEVQERKSGRHMTFSSRRKY